MRILVCGDFLPSKENVNAFSNGDIDNIFDRKTVSLLRNVDYSFCNLEGPITDNKEKIKKSGPSIKTSTSSMNGISMLGIYAFCLANNHIMDYGEEGYFDTIKSLEGNNIVWLGAGENIKKIKKYISLVKDGVSVAVYNVAETEFNMPSDVFPGCNLFDEYDTCKDIQEIKEKHDYVIVIYHGGTEEFRYPTPRVQKRFHNMVNSGAKYIFAQHSHCIGTEERYKDSLLIYGQGNFQFAFSEEDEYTENSLAVELDIEKTKSTEKYHLLKRNGGKTCYDQDQDFKDFYKRAEILRDKKLYENELKKISLERLDLYLDYISCNGIEKKIAKKLYSPTKYKEYLRDLYFNSDLETVLNTMRCGDHNELIIEGLRHLIEMRNKRK